VGFFSDLCVLCGHPALSIYAANSINDWMIQVVVIMPPENGVSQIISGDYDGYGRVGGTDEVVGFREGALYHAACYRLAGTPTQYTRASNSAPDQGYFFGTEHDVPEPQSWADVTAIALAEHRRRVEEEQQDRKRAELRLAQRAMPKKFVLRYLESADEVLEQMADLNADEQWVADHPGETAEEWAEGWAPLYVFDSTPQGGVCSLGGFDSAELAAQDGATVFDTQEEAEAWVAANKGQPGLQGDFEIVEVE
jgi:hypothetical protein